MAEETKNKLDPHPDPETAAKQGGFQTGGLVPPGGLQQAGPGVVRPVEQAARAKPAIDENNEEPTPDKNPEHGGEVGERRDGTAPPQQPSAGEFPVDLAAIISNEFGTPRSLVRVELGAGAKVYFDGEEYTGDTYAIPSEQIQGKVVRVEGPNKTFQFEYAG